MTRPIVPVTRMGRALWGSGGHFRDRVKTEEQLDATLALVPRELTKAEEREVEMIRKVLREAKRP